MRRALIVNGVDGPSPATPQVLARYGFAAPLRATNLDAGLSQLAREQVDLAILPLHDASVTQFAALERESRRAPQLLLIGTAPTADPQLILRAMRAGVHEFLTAPLQAPELAGAVDRLLRRRQAEGQHGKVIPVYSAKGGVGTTTVAVNLAHALARRFGERKVVLADLVADGGDVRLMLNLEPVYDILDAVQKLDRMDAQLIASLVTPGPDGLLVLPGTDNFEHNVHLDGGATELLLSHLRATYPVVILDCEHHLSERTLAAFDAADQVVLVTQLSVAALRSARRSLSLLHRLGYPDEKFCVVVNRHQTDDVLALRDAAEALGRPVYWSIPNDYRTSQLALNKGMPVATVAAESKVAGGYKHLATKFGGDDAAAHRNGSSSNGASRLRNLLGLTRKG